jgi:transposase
VLDGFGRHRDKVSVVAAVTVSPATRRLGLYFQTDPDGYFSNVGVAGFLRALLRHLRGKVVVLWDRGSNHRGTPIREVLARHERLSVEGLPAYSPQLNPVELVWSYLKHGLLLNFVPRDVSHLDEVVTERLAETKCNHYLLRSLWDGSELPFPDRL